MKFDPSLPDDAVNVSDTHPLREALWLVAGVAIVGAALFAALAVAVDLAVPRLPADLEARWFGGAWSGGTEEDAAADPRTPAVEALLLRLAAHWPDHPYDFRATVIEEPAENAMALPGGRVVVTTGLLDGVESENELAFVLGHELGHFRHRDHLRGLGRGLAFGMALQALGLGGAGAAVRIAAISGQLAARGFSRDQERAADAFGLALVAGEYGHVAGAFRFFERAPDPEGAAARRIGPYFATHPLGADRVEALRALARERGWRAEGPLVPLAQPPPDAGPA